MLAKTLFYKKLQITPELADVHSVHLKYLVIYGNVVQLYIGHSNKYKQPDGTSAAHLVDQALPKRPIKPRVLSSCPLPLAPCPLSLALPVRDQSEGHKPSVDHRTPGYQHLADKAGRDDGEA